MLREPSVEADLGKYAYVRSELGSDQQSVGLQAQAAESLVTVNQPCGEIRESSVSCWSVMCAQQQDRSQI